jgi:hypothetical protein
MRLKAHTVYDDGGLFDRPAALTRPAGEPCRSTRKNTGQLVPDHFSGLTRAAGAMLSTSMNS